MRRWFVAIPMLGLCACFSPNVATGVACTEEGECPANQVCVPGALICVDPSDLEGDSDGGLVRADAGQLDVDASPASGDDSCAEILPNSTPNLARCDLPVAGPDIVLTSGEWTFSTSDLTLDGPAALTISTTSVTQSGGPELALLSVQRLEIGSGAVLRVVGLRPLVIASSGDIVISGTLDASAHMETPGPGGDVACASGLGGDGVAQDTEGWEGSIRQGGSGGGGGGFGAAGALGSIVDESPGSATAGGSIEGDVSLSPLRGGCRGGQGGRGGGLGGAGGGGLQLVAAGAITVHDGAVVSAAGGGGGAGFLSTDTFDYNSRGGGGGGSGGAILLQATQVNVFGAVTANGGSGGEGKYLDTGAPGQDGTASLLLAPGGSSGLGGDGGAGSSSGSPAGSDGALGSTRLPLPGCDDFPDPAFLLPICRHYSAGGGGGGGGVGRIRIDASAVDTSGVVTPAAD